MTRQGGGGAKFLTYEIYSDLARTKRWGSAPAETVTVTTPGNGAYLYRTLYGTTIGNVGSGAYLDTITVTITY